jgi:hypothetical protein
MAWRHRIRQHQEILRAGLGEYRLELVLSMSDPSHRHRRGDVDDEDRRRNEVAQADRAVGGFRLGQWGACQRMVGRLGELVLPKMIDHTDKRSVADTTAGPKRDG